jgi:2-octaprenyl-6-methoxyphenol hydroxylase
MTAGATSPAVCIVGAGPVGLFLALLLARAGMRCRVLEARGPSAALGDRRSLALSWGSHLRLCRVGIDVRPPGIGAPILSVHVSQARNAGRTVLSAAEVGLPALGYVTPYQDLVQALLERAASRCELRFDTRVTGLHDNGREVSIASTDGESGADVVVIADGGGEWLEGAGFSTRRHDYGVDAFVATVKVPQADRTTAYERFTTSGPLALLPAAQEHSLVWAMPPKEATGLLASPMMTQIERIQQAFGWRAGRFTAIRDPATFPLCLRTTQPLVHGRVAVIGNAAQSLHPVAGQGLNLGLRDAWSLTRELEARPQDPARALAAHAAARRRDRATTIGFTDTLVRLFSSGVPGLAALRGAGLESLDLLPLPRRVFATTLSSPADH